MNETRTDKLLKQVRKHPIAVLLILATLIYLLLYRHFIFHGAVYMYEDIGSDSLMQMPKPLR